MNNIKVILLSKLTFFASFDNFVLIIMSPLRGSMVIFLLLSSETNGNSSLHNGVFYHNVRRTGRASLLSTFNFQLSTITMSPLWGSVIYDTRLLRFYKRYEHLTL